MNLLQNVSPILRFLTRTPKLLPKSVLASRFFKYLVSIVNACGANGEMFWERTLSKKFARLQAGLLNTLRLHIQSVIVERRLRYGCNAVVEVTKHICMKKFSRSLHQGQHVKNGNLDITN